MVQGMDETQLWKSPASAPSDLLPQPFPACHCHLPVCPVGRLQEAALRMGMRRHLGKKERSCPQQHPSRCRMLIGDELYFSY